MRYLFGSLPWCQELSSFFLSFTEEPNYSFLHFLWWFQVNLVGGGMLKGKTAWHWVKTESFEDSEWHSALRTNSEGFLEFLQLFSIREEEAHRGDDAAVVNKGGGRCRCASHVPATLLRSCIRSLGFFLSPVWWRLLSPLYSCRNWYSERFSAYVGSRSQDVGPPCEPRQLGAKSLAFYCITNKSRCLQNTLITISCPVGCLMFVF